MTNTLCDYGCGKVAGHQLKNGKHCCSKRPSGCDTLKAINRAAVNLTYSEGRVSYDYSSLSAETKLKMSHKGQVLMLAEDVFIDGKEWGSELLRKYLHHYNLLEYKCASELCGITDWHGAHLTLELDHISGVRSDNRIENLRWLCPNCHSQTPTFRGYNKSNTGKKKVSDDELLTAFAESANIRQALQKVGLSAKGGNYERAKKLFTGLLAK
jgi:hypothetical protein